MKIPNAIEINIGIVLYFVDGDLNIFTIDDDSELRGIVEQLRAQALGLTK